MGKSVREIPDDNVVVGWSNGQGLKRPEVSKHLQENPEDQVELRRIKKQRKKSSETRVREPLTGLPPQWQAFYGTVPHLDGKFAYKEYEKLRAKQRANEAALDQLDEQQVEDTIKEENAKLQKQKMEKEAELKEKAKEVAAWEKKIKRMTGKKNQKPEFQRFKDNLEYWRREHSIKTARLKSSEKYFAQREASEKERQSIDKTVLQRTTAQLDQDIHELKEEVISLTEALQRVRQEKDLALPAAASVASDAVSEGGAALALEGSVNAEPER